MFKCLNCGKKFTKSVGGGWNFALLRCVKCDSIKSVEYEVINEDNKILPQKILCRKCGSEMKDAISPMCPYCHSRVNEIEETLIFYD
ncbi:hypothetical protein ACFLWR_07220 [Chloroflexota bacterium]